MSISCAYLICAEAQAAKAQLHRKEENELGEAWAIRFTAITDIEYKPRKQPYKAVFIGASIWLLMYRKRLYGAILGLVRRLPGLS